MGTRNEKPKEGSLRGRGKLLSDWLGEDWEKHRNGRMRADKIGDLAFQGKPRDHPNR